MDDFGKPEVLPNAEGDLTTPSVVYFESADNIVIGKTAKDEAKFRPDQVKSMIKRSMGRKDAEFSYNGVSYKPPEISAYILRKLAEDAEQTTGEPVEDVVITCPAYFGVEQKEATKQAGEIAGLRGCLKTKPLIWLGMDRIFLRFDAYRQATADQNDAEKPPVNPVLFELSPAPSTWLEFSDTLSMSSTSFPNRRRQPSPMV